MRLKPRLALVSIICVAFAARSGEAQQFRLVPRTAAESGPNSFQYGIGIGQDGTVLISTGGQMASRYGYYGSFFHPDGTRSDVGTNLPANTQFYPQGISADSHWAVGSVENDTPGTLPIATAYDMDGTRVTLPNPVGCDRAWARTASHDGTIVAGYAAYRFTQGQSWTPCRWEGGTASLIPAPSNGWAGLSPVATCMSGQGDLIAGVDQESGWAWTATQGTFRLRSNSFASAAYGISGNGAFVVGSGQFADRKFHFVLWDDANVGRDLGTIDGFNARAYGLSDDGRTIVGAAYQNGGQYVACVWTPERGCELLSTYLAANNITVPTNVTLKEGTAITADGRTICGTASVNGINTAFVVTVPSAPTSVILVAALFAAKRRRIVVRG
jgi:uncharacterized membrane protein